LTVGLARSASPFGYSAPVHSFGLSPYQIRINVNPENPYTEFVKSVN
jgi:hypothetical protein